MDALKQLTNHIPNWLTRLDDLGGQVVQRQAELAALAVTDRAAEARSMRNKGSTESLKPKDDGTAMIAEPMDTSSVTRIEDPVDETLNTTQQRPSTPTPEKNEKNETLPTAPTSPSAAALARQAHETVLAAHSRARQVPQKRQRPSSVLSGDGQLPAYRTRTQIIVYYDAHVQRFFDDLVRFVSASRNLLRKAKMAVKVAHIKKLAEMESQDGEDGSEEDEMSLPSLRYMSTRRYGSMVGAYGRGPGGRDQAPDIYDQLDKGLEFVQSTCEHGAHQFLRDADCNDEIRKIQKHLRDVLGMAEKEKERVLREEPELAKETCDAAKVRTRRPISMRREPGGKEGLAPSNEEPEKLEAMEPKLEPEKPAMLQPTAPALLGAKLQVDVPLEVDSDDGDEGIDISQMPKLNFRSTRSMRA
ncbi:hypothetical protein NLU13_4856 [Sarocladium strictum]|uniref:Uncharacterized protein n=1 Tax=Sarocladium strictum TaxID=5046 RepID=A0AA39GJP0_SARSR|nr:hypothetical protein NLU13_4856 [Sarocladium strictum]